VSATRHTLSLQVLPGQLAICQLAAHAELPAWATGALVCITRTADELSIVCPEEVVPPGVRHEKSRRALRVVGQLDMSLVGVLAALTAPLAAADVAIFAISTFDTDYLLVEQAALARAIAALRGAGHLVAEDPAPNR
jgi:hypothetical protein